ncbi:MULTISPECIES: hypothetical protein [unclassified Psychrobacillus]|uniref:hypothetical protein n=1 Tax=unclassified Psychrobacillus TaxID=2636677 RepID=UPI0030F53644
MGQHVSVVYYQKNEKNPDVFYVLDVTKEKLQKAFAEHDVHEIKCITVELEHLTIKDAKTLFLDADIKHYLYSWGIDFTAS